MIADLIQIIFQVFLRSRMPSLCWLQTAVMSNSSDLVWSFSLIIIISDFDLIEKRIIKYPFFIRKSIWKLGTPKFIHEVMKHMNSYMKKSYEFIIYMNSYVNSYTYEFIWSLYEFIDEMIIWIQILLNSYMKWLYEFMSIWIHVYEFKCMDYEFIYEFINIWIQI